MNFLNQFIESNRTALQAGNDADMIVVAPVMGLIAIIMAGVMLAMAVQAEDKKNRRMSYGYAAIFFTLSQVLVGVYALNAPVGTVKVWVLLALAPTGVLGFTFGMLKELWERISSFPVPAFVVPKRERNH